MFVPLNSRIENKKEERRSVGRGVNVCLGLGLRLYHSTLGLKIRKKKEEAWGMA